MQLSLLEPRVRHSDPITSHEAAEKAQKRAERDRAVIYDVICQSGAKGATMRDVAFSGRIGFVEACRRGKEMERAGLISRKLIGYKNNVARYAKRDGCAVWWKS